jgi:ATP-dependent Lhr-like helicase
MTRATDRDSLHDVLRRIGDLTREEVAERVFVGVDAGALIDALVRERRAVELRLGGERRLIAADEAGLYRDALGAAPPGGLPEAFLADVPEALRELVARYARTHGPFAAEDVRRRYGVDASAVLRELERDGAIVRGEIRPGGSSRDWCDTEVLRRLRRASLAALRKEIEPADQRRLAAFLPSWQGVDRHTRAGAGVDRLREVLVPLQGLALPVETWERDVLPRRTGAYSQTWLDALCASGELVWIGAGALGRSGRVALYFRDDAAAIGPPAGQRGATVMPEAPEHELLRARLARGPAFFTDLLAELEGSPEALREALWDLVWAGEVTNDAWAPLRAPRLSLARGESAGRQSARPGRSRFAARRSTGAQSQVQGRWSLTTEVFGSAPDAAVAPERRRTIAELLLERYGIVTREQVLAEGIKGGFAMLYDTFARLETLGICRRGYFIEGMGGAQFALPGAVERLRAAPLRDGDGPATLVLAAADPAQPYGAALPWPKRAGSDRRPARVAGAYVVTVAQQPVLYVERGGRGLITLGEQAGQTPAPGRPDAVEVALAALADAVRNGRVGKLALERIDGEPAISSAFVRALTELGFQTGPRRLTLSA